jgi:hypothetical protein
MPYTNTMMCRVWCPLGDECGKKETYLSEVSNRAEAEDVLAQHLRNNPAHAEVGYSDQFIIDAVTTADYEGFERERYSRSPSRSTTDGKGKKVAGKGSKPIGKGIARVDARRDKRHKRVRSRSRSRAKVQKEVEDMQAEINALKQELATQKTSTTKQTNSMSGAVPTIHIGGESGFAILTERASSGTPIGDMISFNRPIGSDPHIISLNRLQLEEAMSYMQLVQTRCLDSANICGMASTGFNTKAFALNKLRQKLICTVRCQM